MGTRKGSWRKFFCCAGPPETQSSTCINISESDHVKPPLPPELEQEDEDLYIEAEAQTSNVEIPGGNRWRWSRLHNEVEVQTSLVLLPIEEIESASETDAQTQTSFLNLSREAEAQTQTSFLSLRSPAPFETEAQVQTSFTEVPRESCAEAQVQTSLFSLPRERDAQAQTSFLSLRSPAPFETEAQVQTSFTELSREPSAEAQVQTSLFSLPREREVQVQTSFQSLRSPALFETEAQVQTSFTELSREPSANAQVQTSLFSLPRGREAQAQTSFQSLQSPAPFETETQVQTSFTELSREPSTDAQVQTSLFSLPRGREAQAQTSFQSLQSPAPFETETQVQTSFTKLPRESCAEAQVQTSLLSLPREREVQAQTSFLSLPERESVISIQVQPSYIGVLEKIASLPMLVEAPVQTSSLEMLPAQTDIHVQTSFSDYMSEKEDTSSIETEQQSKRSPSQQSEMDFSTLYPLYTDAEVQTLPVAIPPGNDWRSARLKAAAQVQTSNISLEKPVPLPQGELQVRPSKFKIYKGAELEAPLAIEEKSFPSEPTEIGTQTSDPEVLEKGKWHLSQLQSDAQVQTSTIELLKKLSVLSQIETMESPSRSELMNKVSSLSVTDPLMQLQRKPSSLSESVDQGQLLNAELLKMRPSSAQVIPTSGYEPAGKLHLSSPTREVQVQTSDLELLKKLSSSSQTEPQRRTSVADLRKYSSLSLVETMDQEEVTEGRDYLITPQVMETQIRKWYHEFPEVQIASQAPVQREPLLSPTVDSEVQTLSVEIPQRNRWRASRLQADVELQTSGLELAVGEVKPCHQSWNDTQTQTSLLKIWQARGSADAQIQTSDFDLARSKTEFPPPLVIDRQVQTSSLDILKAKEGADVQTQTSVTELPMQVTESAPIEQIERLAQTEFLEIWKAKEPDSLQEKTSEFLGPKEENFRLQTDLEVQTSLSDMWRGKEKADMQAQTSQLEIPAVQEELPLSLQTDAVMQTSDVEIPVGSTWRASRLHTDVQLQTSMLDMKETELESPPTSEMDSQVQTSLLDIWKTKELRDARAQTSWADVSESLEDPPLPPQPKDGVQLPTQESAETSPLSQQDTEVQTSFLDIWKAKEVSSSLVQTSQVDMSGSLEDPPLPPQSENVVQSPTPDTTESPPPNQSETQAQTSFLEIWKAKELANAQIQTSQMDLPKAMKEPLLQSQSESPVQIATTEPPPPNQLNPEKQTSLLEMWKVRESMESSELPEFSPSPTATKAQSSQHDLQTLEAQPSAQMLSAKTDVASATPEPTVPSRSASPVCLPAPVNMEAALFAQTQEPISLLEVWSTRQEAEVQMQTANLGSPFDEDSPLFPMLLESQEEKRPEQMSGVEKKPKPPLFTEAQVQTSFVEIPKGKKWRASRLCTEAQVQTSFPDLRVKDRMPALQKMVSDHVASRRVSKGPKRAAPVSVHLHVKMSPKRRTSIEKK